MRFHPVSLSIRDLPPRQSLILAALTILLVAASVLPANSLVDSDRLGYGVAATLALTALLMAVHDRRDEIDLAAWRNRALALVITFGIAAIGAEFSTRWIFREVTTSSDNGGYFSRRWARTDAVRMNAAGFRGRSFDPAKAAGVYRIAIVGDSFTYGNGIRQEERYSDLLQERLPPTVEVLNFGQPGANTPQHRQRVEAVLQEGLPDFVLLQWYVNDTEGDDSSGRPTFYRLMPIRWLHDWLSAESALYTVANMRWAEMQIATGMMYSYDAYLQRRLGDPNSPDSIRDRDMLSDIIALCRKHGVPLGIVLFPDTSGDLGETYRFAYLHDRVLEQCNAQNLTCLDLRRDFAGVKDRQTLWANQLDHHPSARANAIAAVRLFETFATKWAASPSR